MHLPNLFGKRSSRQAARPNRARRLAVEGLEARQMLDVDPGTLTGVIPLDIVDFTRQENLDLAAADVWYSAEAGRDGFFSLEATDVGSSSDATLILHGSDGVMLADSTGTANPQRLDWEADQGNTFLIQVKGSSSDVDLTLANLVEHVGDTVTVGDSTGDDEFVFSIASTQRQITINNLIYRFFNSDGTNVVFIAGDGHDTARLFDSQGNDTFEAGPDMATLSGDGYSVSVLGVEEVYAYASTGGVDTVKLYDSPGDDTFVSGVSYSKLRGDGFFIRAKSFDFVHGYATNDGNDRAKMYDSASRDTFIATPTYAKMFHGKGDAKELSARAKFFETVYAYASEGTRDSATLYGSDGNDTFTSGRSRGVLSGQDSEGRDFAISVNDFFVTRAYDGSGGFDIANLYDSKYQETFDASPTEGTLQGAKLYLLARGFEEIHAHSREFGGDVANLQDSAGNDTFIGKAKDETCKLSGTGFFLRAEDFDEVYAESTAGGNDIATFGDSIADDLLEAFDDWARISSTGGGIDYLYGVKGFDPVEANSSNGGTDTSDIDSGISFVLVDNWT